MKKLLASFLLVTAITYSASYKNCDSAVKSRGYSITGTFSQSPDSGGELARGYTASKNGKLYSIYVEVSSSGSVLVFDVLQIG